MEGGRCSRNSSFFVIHIKVRLSRKEVQLQSPSRVNSLISSVRSLLISVPGPGLIVTGP